MTVACRMINCPLYDNGFCCSESILITIDGRCFNLIKGFSPDDDKKLRETSKINIEDIDTEIEESEVKEKDDNIRCDEGT